MAAHLGRKFRVLAVLAIAFLFASVAVAQTATLAVTAASVTIDPTSTDTYDIQGSFTGISLGGATLVSFSVGNFGGSVPIDSFVQQPGTNLFVYQDTAGESPAWFSSLTLDLDAGTFEAKASGIVLAGLTNPFAVQLGTDQGGPCTMARVLQSSPGSYQLSAGDGGGACTLNIPIASPAVASAGNSTQVTFTLNALAGIALDPGSAQLFLADDNAQPLGDPLCMMADAGGSAYTCGVTFNQPNAGMVPLLVLATVAGQTVLAPGFALQVTGPVTDANVQQVADIQNAMSQAWPAFNQFGDSVHARMLALAALRAILPPQPRLTGQTVGLAADGLSIYARSDSGLPIVLALDDLADMLPAATPAPAGLPHPAAHPDRPIPRGIVFEPLKCGAYSRDIVKNNKVMVWSPGDIFGFLGYRAMVQKLQNSKCPAFQVDILKGSAATIEALNRFPDYGTVIMNTHGSWDHAWLFVLTGEPAARSVTELANAVGIEGSACVPEGCFKTVYPNHPNIHALSNTIMYAGFCHSADNVVYQLGGFSNAFVPEGTSSTYFGYIGSTYAFEDVTKGGPLMDSLVNQYSNTADAYASAKFQAVPGRPKPRSLYRYYPPAHFQMLGDQNLAYVGNPVLALHTLAPPVTGAQGVEASLDGTSSCGQNDAPYMNVLWANPAQAGHLTYQTHLVSGSQDDFTNEATQAADQGSAKGSAATPGYSAIAKYMPSPDLPAVSDDLRAEFYPDPANSPAAVACLTVNTPAGLFVNNQVATVWNDLMPALRAYEAPVNPPRKVTQTYTVPLQDMVGAANHGAQAKISVTHTGPAKWTVDVTVAAADPNSLNAIVQPDAGPFMGLAQLDLSVLNPGFGGNTMAKIDGQIHNAPVSVTAGSPPRTFTTAAGGTINIFDSRGRLLVNGSLNPGDPKATPTSFTATVDSSCSGLTQVTAQCPNPQAVGINISLGENLVTVPSPVTFSLTLNIEFVNQ